MDLEDARVTSNEYCLKYSFSQDKIESLSMQYEEERRKVRVLE